MPHPPYSRRALAYGAMVLTTLLWGSNPAVSRLVLERLSPVSLVWLRWLIVLALLAPLVWPERAAIKEALLRHWRVLVPFAMLGFAPQNLIVFTGLAGSSATHLSLLNSTIPVFIILIGWLWRERRPHGLESLGLTISLVGVMLIIVHGDLGALLRLELNGWDLLMLAGILVWAIYTLRMAERPTFLALLPFVFATALLGELITLPAIVFEVAWQGWPELDARTLVALLYVGAFPSLLATLLFGFAVRRIGAVHAGILSHLVPVFGSFFAATLIGERLHLYHGLGFLLVAGGAILSCFRPQPVLSSPPSVKS